MLREKYRLRGTWSRKYFSTTYLNLWCDLHRLQEGYNLTLQGLHGGDMLAPLVKVHAVDTSKELLQMGLDDGRVLGLAQDLQEVVVTDEVETRQD